MAGVRDLPFGTVTFLFSDIEGSTRLLKQLGRERYSEVLAGATHCSARPSPNTGGRRSTGRAQTELAATWARPRRLKLTGLESLTPSERRVADMAAEI
jgi:class 3 adenylate cyclase